jgi:hypothetical protein
MRLEDDLQQDIEPFRMNDGDCEVHTDDSVEESSTTMKGQRLEDLLELLNMEGEEGDVPAIPGRTDNNLPSFRSLHTIRQKGCLKYGYKCLVDRPSTLHCNAVPVVQTQLTGTSQELDTLDEITDKSQMQMTPSQQDIVKLLLSRSTRQSRTFKEISKNNKPVNVPEANGSVRNIIDWAKKAGLDRGQRRAFEIMMGTFILTLFAGAPAQSETRGQTLRHLFISEKKQLERLTDVRKRGSDQMICLPHGPGVSEKTAVMNLFDGIRLRVLRLLGKF